MFSWGRIMLAHFYHDLRDYVYGGGCSLMMCTLVQVLMFKHITLTMPPRVPIDIGSDDPREYAYPLTRPWKNGDLLHWRIVIDRLILDIITWRLYRHMTTWLG